jgi:putative DNA primase/helicase
MPITTSIRYIASALGGDVASRNRVLMPGPGHSRKDRSLSVTFSGDNFLCHSFCGDDWRECRDHVKALLGWSDDVTRHHNDNIPQVDVSALADERVRIARGMAIWRNARPLADTPAEAYLHSRGLDYEGDSLRFHPSCPFRKERHPALVALMVDIITNEPRGVHRTALLPDGSGKSAPGKMMLGVAGGACVKLSPDDDVTQGLAIAEGIETALAVPFRPVWACLSAGTMAAFPVLSGIEALTVYADHDATGIRAANTCGERWHSAGREVTIAAPPSVGADFADLRGAA